MSMDEYYQFVLTNLKHVSDHQALEQQIKKEKKMKYSLFRI